LFVPECVQHVITRSAKREESNPARAAQHRREPDNLFDGRWLRFRQPAFRKLARFSRGVKGGASVWHRVARIPLVQLRIFARLRDRRERKVHSAVGQQTSASPRATSNSGFLIGRIFFRKTAAHPASSAGQIFRKCSKNC
jgi:hypothetical protein